MYSIYCQNRPNSIEAQERCKKKYPKFSKFLDDQMATTNGLSLDSYLVKPVQRIWFDSFILLMQHLSVMQGILTR
jgi:hypothetical protein